MMLGAIVSVTLLEGNVQAIFLVVSGGVMFLVWSLTGVWIVYKRKLSLFFIEIKGFSAIAIGLILLISQLSLGVLMFITAYYLISL